MDAIRFGRGIRALRHRRGWRQEDLGNAAGVSRSVIWRIERGRADHVTVARLERVAEALGARIVVRLDWNGVELDRLLDGLHARNVDALVALLSGLGWTCVAEATFNVFGERGSIDILAWHPATRSLLIIEVKTLIPDVGPMLAALDRKTRLAERIARDRGWIPSSVSRLLVVAEGATARRHVSRLAATFDSAFPVRNVAVRRWLARPAGRISGLWFFSNALGASAPTRISKRPRRAVQGGPASPSQIVEGGNS